LKLKAKAKAALTAPKGEQQANYVSDTENKVDLTVKKIETIEHN
jgi:hypothetical protein